MEKNPTYFDSSVFYFCFRVVLGPFESDSIEFQFHCFLLYIHSRDTFLTHRGVEVTVFYSMSFPYFEHRSLKDESQASEAADHSAVLTGGLMTKMFVQ